VSLDGPPAIPDSGWCPTAQPSAEGLPRKNIRRTLVLLSNNWFLRQRWRVDPAGSNTPRVRVQRTDTGIEEPWLKSGKEEESTEHLDRKVFTGIAMSQSLWPRLHLLVAARVRRRTQSGMGEDMEKEIIFLVEEAAEGGYQARALGHPIFTEADSLEELRAMVQDAVQCHFEKRERPSVIRLHIVKDEVITP